MLTLANPLQATASQAYRTYNRTSAHPNWWRKKWQKMDQIFLVVMIAMMGFLLWNSSRTRKKQAQLLASQLEVGVEVMLGSGVFGTVESIAGDRLVIKSAGSTLEVARGAVARVLPGPAAAETPVSKAAAQKKAAPAAKATNTQAKASTTAVKKTASTAKNTASAKATSKKAN